jgi:putative transcriptional regulator
VSRTDYNRRVQNLNLTGHFLIAMPSMADPHFAKSLTFICEHNDQGALGLVVNRPTDMTLQVLFEQIGIELTEPALHGIPVHFGGPVQTNRGFVLHQPIGDWQSTLPVNGIVGLTTSKDILEAVGGGSGPRHILITLGYAGWAPGQLEHELAQNAWLTVPATPDILFSVPPEHRLPAAMQRLGVDFATLSDAAGHA